MTTIEAMWQDARWVESGIFNYDLTTSVPYTFSLLYTDGAVLSIPLTLMFFEPLPTASGTLLFMRRHRGSGKNIPFQISQTDPRLRDPSLKALPYQQALEKIAPPRFDTKLTPKIMAMVNELQAIYMVTGFLHVFEWQLLNPLIAGWAPAAVESDAVRLAFTRMALRRGAQVVAEDAVAVGERLLAEVGAVRGTGLQRFLELARRLSAVKGLNPQAKADLLMSMARRLGLDVGGQATVKGGRILLVAKDAKSALQIAADGTITFGRFSIETLDIVNPAAIRPL
jgi:hypothetical protein